MKRMLKFKNFTFKLTEDCNFHCSYCEQTASKQYLQNSQIQTALDFFSPYLEIDSYINFYGGEPLLALPQIKYIKEAILSKAQGQSRPFRYTISTNGSLLSEEILEYLNQNKISPLISFDGYAQEITRKKATFNSTVKVIKSLVSTDLDFVVNSVFIPKTIEHISHSMRFLIEMGVPKINLTFSTVYPWQESDIKQLKDELLELREVLIFHYSDTQKIPIQNYSGKPSKKVFSCSAGKDRMTLMPDGSLWGCHLFANYFNYAKDPSVRDKYCFGDLNDFVEKHELIYPRIISNHAFLRMEYFSTEKTHCLFCSDIVNCAICPAYSALTTGRVGDIPVWACKIKRVMREEKRFFQEIIKKPVRGHC